MARTKELTEELLNMSLKDLLSMRNHLEDYVGMTVIPTIDLRILPSPGKKCGCRKEQTYEVIITKVGEMHKAIQGILGKMTKLNEEEIQQILASNYGKVGDGKNKEEAESLKSALEGVGAEVILK